MRSVAAGESISNAATGARLDGAPWRTPGPDGIVRFDSVAEERHALTIRAFGYHLATDTVDVQPDSGLIALAVMARDRAVFDEGCGLMRKRVRKPWWKLW